MIEEKSRMFQEHKDFEQVENSSVLWRYQDLPRYLDLLLKKQLFFCRIDRYEDPFEGRYNKKSAQDFLKRDEKAKPADTKKNESHPLEQEIKEMNEELIEKRTFVTANSWHENSSENFAMWKIYAKGSYGIALQTNFERLKKCFHLTEKPIHIGKVKYYDENVDLLPYSKNSLLPFLSKRHIYEYENEIRCCYLINEEEHADFNWEEQDKINGIFIPVDLDTMIEKIYISPYSPNWIKDIVQGINKKFELHKEIVHSTVFESVDY